MELNYSERRARQILIWLGAAEQHLENRLNRLLKGGDVSLAQFIILNHLAGLPAEGWTVSRLASALDTGQPGVSKILARLVAKGYVAIEADASDARRKRHMLTEAGRAAYRDAYRRVAPLTDTLLAGWDEAHIDTLHTLLYRLKTRLRAGPEIF
jgi:DNA-binding MarR family transcriptional regulator